MAIKKSNRLLWVLVGLMLILAVPIVFNRNQTEQYQPLEHIPTASHPTADTALDTLKGFQAEMEAANQKLEAMNERNLALTQSLGQDQHTIEQLQHDAERYQQDQEQLSQQLSQTLEELQQLKRQLAENPKPPASSSSSEQPLFDDIPPGLGYDDLVSTSPKTNGQWLPLTDDDDPKTQPTVSQSVKRYLNSTRETVSQTVDATKQSLTEVQKNLKPKLTIAKTAVGLDALAWTALIGRVPSKGSVSDPYPAKFIIGRDILMANGFTQPGVAGAFLSGIAKGDRTLQCVSVDINTLSFIFHDGRILTHHAQNGERLAWISDSVGWPCVSGELISNATNQLLKRSGAQLFGTAGEALAETQETTTRGALGDSTSFISGDTAKYVFGKVASQTAQELTQWLIAQADNSFDAIIVPPNQRVAVHFDEDIAIDYDPSDRLVVYHTKEHSDVALD